MKIVTWNCNGALRNKTDAIERLNADILIIQECENPAASTKHFQEWAGSNFLWVGESKNKGIGVFSRNGHTVEQLAWSGSYQIPGIQNQSSALRWATNELQQFLPFRVDNRLTILGVWTKSSVRDEIFGYIGQFWKYLQIHRSNLSDPGTLISGDFNSNSIWDKPDRWWNHTDVIAELDTLGLTSIYHHQSDEIQGKESSPTFFLHRHRDKPFHIDYCFASSDMIERCTISIGNPKDWLLYSDHLPLSVTLR
jgi:exonuclease III